jgi:hypothetical protein
MTVKLHHNKLRIRPRLAKKIECFVCGDIGCEKLFNLYNRTFHYITRGWIRQWHYSVSVSEQNDDDLRYYCPKCIVFSKLPEAVTNGTK